jgi:hypothetical protein
MQNLPLQLHQEFECSRQRELRAGAQPRSRKPRRFKLSFRRNS